jgi:CheY-like chemotaxis protein
MTKQLTILLVEDVEIAQTATLNVLHLLDCQVDLAAKGGQALELLKKNRYDLVILDLGLPDTDGFKLAKSILHPVDQNIPTPVAVLTIHGDDGYRKRCMDIGVSAFWIKPLQIENIKQLFKYIVPEMIN